MKDIITIKDHDDYIEKTTDWLRGKLGINVEQQQKFRNSEVAFKSWRNNIERELCIFVFQFPMPENELDGFSFICEDPPYAIVINSSTLVPQRKIFTLFHELSHVIKHEPGICLPDIIREKKDFEFLCNEFAGKFLIPDEYVYPFRDVGDLRKIASLFKVSSEVILRRNIERNFINKKDFFGYLKQLKSISPKVKKRKEFGSVDSLNISKSYRGNKFFSLVLVQRS